MGSKNVCVSGKGEWGLLHFNISTSISQKVTPKVANWKDHKFLACSLLRISAQELMTDVEEGEHSGACVDEQRPDILHLLKATLLPPGGLLLGEADKEE